MPHNHSPRCCCSQPHHSIRATSETCPSCVEHGELATLNTPANTPAPPTECPSCHAIGDQPHTDYCRAGLHATHRWGKVMQGQINFPEVCVNCLVRADRPDAQLACPRYDQAGQTSQPAATTSQPATETRGAVIAAALDSAIRTQIHCTGHRTPGQPGVIHNTACPWHPGAVITPIT